MKSLKLKVEGKKWVGSAVPSGPLTSSNVIRKMQNVNSKE